MQDLMAQDVLWRQQATSTANTTRTNAPDPSSTGQSQDLEQLQNPDEEWFHAGLLWLRPSLLNLDGNERQELYEVHTRFVPNLLLNLL